MKGSAKLQDVIDGIVRVDGVQVVDVCRSITKGYRVRVQTFRNRRLSILQSALAEHLYSQGQASRAQGDASDHPQMQSLARMGKGFEELTPGEPLPSLEAILQKSATAPVGADVCAHAVIELLFGGMRDRIRAAVDLSPFGRCDAGWLKVIAAYYENLWFGGKIPYISAKSPSDSIFDQLPDSCRIGIIGDWGTGTPVALDVLLQVKKFRDEDKARPFILLHLGDVYYSGTAAEYARFKQQIREIFLDEPVFTLSGNHDMYSGGQPYYDTIADLNQAPFTQNTSFFCLRNRNWQFQAMDTGLHDRDPFEVTSDLTYLEPSEIDWHRAQLAAAEGRKVILLSHHQPFSAFAPVGKDQNKKDVFINRRLLSVIDGKGPDSQGQDFTSKVTSWLFGHEHNTIIYKPCQGIANARCLGSSAIPADPADGDPYKTVDSDIRWDESAKLKITGGLYNHGYAIMDFDNAVGKIRYFQFPTETDVPMYVDSFNL